MNSHLGENGSRPRSKLKSAIKVVAGLFLGIVGIVLTEMLHLGFVGFILSAIFFVMFLGDMKSLIEHPFGEKSVSTQPIASSRIYLTAYVFATFFGVVVLYTVVAGLVLTAAFMSIAVAAMLGWLLLPVGGIVIPLLVTWRFLGRASLYIGEKFHVAMAYAIFKNLFIHTVTYGVYVYAFYELSKEQALGIIPYLGAIAAYPLIMTSYYFIVEAAFSGKFQGARRRALLVLPSLLSLAGFAVLFLMLRT